MRFVSSFRAVARAACLVFLFAAVAGCSTTGALGTVEAPRPAGDPSRHAALVVDGNTGKVLYQVNADAARYPASLTKMMTLYMTFEALDSGRLSRSAQIPVSAYAASRPPSRIGLRRGQTIDVETAVRALATKSANDVAAALGEALGGSEERFAQMMTAKARQIGMRDTVFRNASGLPDGEQTTTARDMAVLGLALRKRFPHYYDYFSATSFVYKGRTIRGHNDLLGRVRGVDGIKTGYIRASGFNIVTSVNADGRKLVIVVMGGKTARSRNDEVEQLIARYLPGASRGPATTVAAPAAPMPAPQSATALISDPVRPQVPIEQGGSLED